MSFSLSLRAAPGNARLLCGGSPRPCWTELLPRRRTVHSGPGGAGASAWLVYADTRIATLAGSLCRCAANGSTLPHLEAMGPLPISRAVNAVALCNRMLDSRPGCEPERVGRVAFSPAIRVFVQRGRSGAAAARGALEDDEPDLPGQQSGAAPRRTMQLHLRRVPRTSRVPRDDEDVIRTSKSTDIVRLSGLISTRWANVEADVGEPDIIVQGMGPNSLNIMVRAFAMSWEKAARSYEGGFTEAAFSCLPSHIALEGDVSAQAGRFSGVQCIVVPPEAE